MALTNNNLVKVSGAVADEKQEMADAGAIVTTVGDPGTDVNFPTEKAVRSAVAAVAGDLSTHTTTHPIPSTRDARNEAALGNPVTDDYILSSKTDGTRVWVAPGGGGGGGIDWNNVITENTTAAEDKGYLMNASINPVTLTLPASPTTGDVVGVALLDKTNTAVVARNGLKIMGEETDLTLDVDDVAFTLIYSGAAQGWKILTYLPLGSAAAWEADGATSIKPTDSKTVSMDNMVEGADAKVLTAAERTSISANASTLSGHITTHPAPTERDDRNEAVLGNPVTDDFILSSKADGTRTWVDPGGGGGGGMAANRLTAKLLYGGI